jgi:hypothetical protein
MPATTRITIRRDRDCWAVLVDGRPVVTGLSHLDALAWRAHLEAAR